MADDWPSSAESGTDRAPSATSDVDPDRDSRQWSTYGLAVLVAAVFLAGIARLVAPVGAALLLMTVLSLFGVAVAFLAVRERLAEE